MYALAIDYLNEVAEKYEQKACNADFGATHAFTEGARDARKGEAIAYYAKRDEIKRAVTLLESCGRALKSSPKVTK